MPRLHNLLLLLLRLRLRRLSQEQARRRRRWNRTPFTMRLPPSVDVLLKRRRPPGRRRWPIEDLPMDIMKLVLSHLPISDLVRLRAVSKFFSISIHSLPGPFRRDPFFYVFYCLEARRAAVYQPYQDRWRLPLVHHFPTAASGSQLVITNFSLFEPSSRIVWTRTITNVYLYDPFANAVTVIPPPAIPWSLGVALAVSGTGNCKVATLTFFPPRLQVYDHHQGAWTLGYLPDYMNFFETAVPFNGFLYILINRSNTLMRVNIEVDPWLLADLAMPSQFCKHLLAFDGRLFLVGGAQEDLAIVSLRIWELVLYPEEIFQWRWVAAMPDEFSPEFIVGGMWNFFKVCSGAGFICFYHLITHRVLLCDMVDWRWRWASDCPVPTHLRDVWLGCAVEPNANLLR